MNGSPATVWDEGKNREVSRIIHTCTYDRFNEAISAELDGSLAVVNIGCGRLPLRNGINIDRVRVPGADVLCDLRHGLPFRDNSIDCVVAFNVLEHMTVEEFHATLKEMHRVCRDNALVKIEVPYFASESAYSTIDHRLFFAYNTFLRYRIGDWDPTTEKLFDKVQVRLIWHTHRYLRPISFVLSGIVNAHLLIAMGYQNFLCWIIPMKALDIVARVKK